MRGLITDGPMAINYDKLMALKIPDTEHSYGEKDTMLYGARVGLGHDPTDRAELDYVYEKNLKALRHSPACSAIRASGCAISTPASTGCASSTANRASR